MSLLHPRDREILLAEYKMLHDSIARRNAITQTINSVLLPSSIIIVAVAIEFRESLDSLFPFRASGVLPLFSALVLFFLYFSTWTTRKTNHFSWNRLHEIEKLLGIKGERYVYSVIRNTWWWRNRRRPWDILFLLSVVACLTSSVMLFLH